jgi:branched-subunit amino acid ABC-type transport system permease component
MQGQFWIIQTLNSVAFGGLLFLLSSGFSLIFGLMRIPNLAHGAFFMLGAYFGFTLLQLKLHFWLAALIGGLGVGLLGIVMERVVLRRLAGNEQGQVLVTLGVSFIPCRSRLRKHSARRCALPDSRSPPIGWSCWGSRLPPHWRSTS